MAKNKKIIGRSDKADFPDLDLHQIDIKIDTGAYTSSIHCIDIEEVGNELHCTFLDENHPSYHGKVIKFKEYDITSVKSSNGEQQLRYEVRSKIKLFNKTYKISLTLASRQEMRYPVLIGRKFLSKKFVVDTELQDVSYLLTQHEN